MPNFTVRDVPIDVIEKLDNIAKRKKISRNQLIIRALELYADCQDEKLHKMLPLMVECEVKDELRHFQECTKETMNLIMSACLRIAKTNEKLNSFLFPELEKLKIDGMDCEQLLAIINSENEFNDDDFFENLIENETIVF